MNHIKIIITFTVCFLFVFGQTFSQTDSLNSDNSKGKSSTFPLLKNKSWEIGLNLLTLINKEKSIYNVIVRRNYGKGAFRLRPMFNAQYTPNPTGISTFNAKRIEFGLFIGHEWKKNITSKFEIFYGAEVGYSKVNQKNSVLDDPNGTSYYTVLESYNDKALANIFVGPKFFVARHLSVSLETTLSGVMTKAKIDSKRYQSSTNLNDVLISVEKTKYSEWYKEFNLIPIYAINISYHF